MRKHLAALALSASVLALAGPQAQAQTAINVSYQPSLYWALPFHVATEKGWWQELDLEPAFSIFPAGAPQIAAAQAESWDVGGVGSVPAVLGAARFGIVTIGLTNDESKANALMVRGDAFEALKADPASIKGQKVLITTNSTADFAAQNCLKSWGLAKRDVQFVNLGQAQIISSITSNNGDIAGVWAPNTYTLEEKAGARYLCSGADAGVVVPGTLVARADYAEEHPEEIAKFLAVYLRGWAWAKAHPEDALVMMKAFYAQGGIEISDRAAKEEFALRPTFSLEEQLTLMDRAQGASQLDRWLGSIAEFMKSVGTIPKVPEPASFIDPSFMERVAGDPALKAFAGNAN